MSAVKAASGVAVDVVVTDLSTGATSTMTGAVTYSSAPRLPNVIKLISAPSGTVFIGAIYSGSNPAPPPFAVQIFGPDGVTPVPGESVTFSATAGSVQFVACPNSSGTCTVTTDANGIASAPVSPQAAGAITLLATDGSLTQTVSFTAELQAGSINIWLAPSGSVPVGQQQLIALNELTTTGQWLPSRNLSFTVPVGSATFAGCASSACTITTNTSGSGLMWVTPTAAGPITIQIADGSVTSSISFTAFGDVETLQVVATPSPAVFPPNNSGTFSVQLLHQNGTPDTGGSVTFSASPGVSLYPCLTNVCTISTAYWGQVTVGVSAAQPGTYTVEATYQSSTQTLTQSSSFTVLATTQQIRILSAPSGTVPVGQAAATPFTAQLLQNGATPMANMAVTLAAPSGTVSFANCPAGHPACFLITDANGIVSSPLTPLVPGVITLSAVYAGSTATTTFNAAGPGRTMNLISPPTQVWVGDPITLNAQVIAPGGLAGFAGDLVQFAVLSGNFTFTDWPYQPRLVATDGNGFVSEFGVATAPGTISIQASDGTVTQVFTFQASLRPDILRLVNQPADGAPVGSPASTPLSVQVLLADGVTVVPGRSAIVSVTSGSATLSGCGGASSCTLTADSTGLTTTAVTPLAAGPVTITVNDGGVLLTATFNAIPTIKPELLALTQSPSATIYVGQTTSTPLQVQVTQADGTTPVAGVTITFGESPLSPGSVQFSACNAANCTVTTDANGFASTLATGITPGVASLVASATLPTGVQSVSAPLLVVANQFSLTAQNPNTYVAANQTVTLSLSVTAIENGSPAIDQPIVWTPQPGFLAAVTKTSTDATGSSSIQAVLGPLASEASASITACAWQTICTSFSAIAVDPSALQIAISAGASQSATPASPPSPIVALVTDAAGHPVIAAPVSIYQTAYALVDCPASGRCPAAAELGSLAKVIVTGPRRHRHHRASHHSQHRYHDAARFFHRITSLRLDFGHQPTLRVSAPPPSI